jgi:hypothetical protein
MIDISTLKFDEKGLIPAVVVEALAASESVIRVRLIK